MERTGSNLYSIPNILSLLRLALVPVLVGLASAQRGDIFLVVLAVSLLSDVLDGYLARKLGLVSELGAKLDSWGDILTYAAMILGLHLIWPDIFDKQAEFLFAAMMSFILPTLLAFRKFGAYPSYHTWGAKLAAVLIAPAYYVLILADADSFFRVVILFHLLVAAEEMAITFILNRPRSNVGSVFYLGSDLSGRRK
ncbi:CDP-alcohol phosphatidyltransferase family protein [Porticoccaceae bacterium]|jgi:CDP-diacylglycerol--glycerol-3-phosphate 3-phosphatidyltransferase|nr:CDP-alcohol phosphatidyltransferase family protein [Porticoccaceae bacterium]MDA8885346.1 CDP-alcohol phosphatidyltransferase family protein [Porticoccaceae bacterium]MDA8903251.1 CDP-alcohol phosphatidyltransferase family protein [Porticoccaceae bacterium]MDA8919762.1 CDP-alcohol phosphatidyltransferase family protein [Porticoccaceae bacterium]MDA8936222.1 CDP-alcohol phosphatidyltransferase family protein [Porticoccaceae bacterium]